MIDLGPPRMHAAPLHHAFHVLLVLLVQFTSASRGPTDKMNSRTRFKVVTFAPPNILRPVLQENRKNCLQTYDLVETARTGQF